MSTIKSIFIQHLNGTTPNATMDTNGNFTVGGTVSGASSNMFRNRIINGDMRIDQRNAGASVTINTAAWTYAVDRFAGWGQSTDGVFTLQQSTTAPAGFTNSLKATVTTADSSIGATQEYLIKQDIEGYNIADLAWGTSSAKTITLSFWVYSSVTGTFGGTIQNSGGNRTYPFTYTISSSNTWEQKTITISGDTTGTWSTNNLQGIKIWWSMGVGSTYLGTAGSWAGTYYSGASGQTNIISTLNATWYLAGVQLEIGTTATPFEVRSYGHELALCQRYYWKSYAQGTAPGTTTLDGVNGLISATTSSSAILFNWDFPSSMRAAPTLTVYSVTGSSGYTTMNGSWSTAGGANLAISGSNVTETHAVLRAQTTGYVDGYYAMAHLVASIEL